MLLPLGPMNMDMQEEMTLPSEVRGKHSICWWLLLACFVGLFVLQILAVDVFGCIFTCIMGVIVWYMASNNCARMSQYCLFLFGMLCVIQAIFELITLLTMVGGRRMSHTTASETAVGSRTTAVTYTTVIESHSFFDGSMGFRYNAQSAMRIASPAVMLLAVFLAYWSYNAFPTGLFSYRDEEVGPLYGGGGGGGGRLGGNPNYGGPAGRSDHGGQGQGGGRVVVGGRQNAGPRLFEGSGQRLGGN